MTEDHDFNRNLDVDRRMEMDAGARPVTSTPWGWIAGAVFIVVVLALIFSGAPSTQTARNDVNAPATTGMAPRTAQPPMTSPPMTTPSTAPSTTGQGR